MQTSRSLFNQILIGILFGRLGWVGLLISSAQNPMFAIFIVFSLLSIATTAVGAFLAP